MMYRRIHWSAIHTYGKRTGFWGIRARLTLSLFLVAAILCAVVGSAYAAGYTAMIAQGNTTDVGDAKAVFDGLKTVPSPNTYTISNRGWVYNGGDSYPLEDRATAQNLIDAGTHNVLYWTGHGGTGGGTQPQLNVNATVVGGNFQLINVASTLGVYGSNWSNDCRWKNGNISVAIFGACNQLDISVVKYYVRLMQASNLRAIAGYHETSPTHPIDTQIANEFFVQVRAGNSVWYSWRVANEENSVAGRWAVLVYKSNSNQYYRIPGFPGNTYSPPATGSTVYRYWNSYPDGQPISPNSLTDEVLQSLPVYIRATEDSDLNLAVSEREMTDDKGTFQSDEAEESTHSFISQYLDKKSLESSLLIQSEVRRAEVDVDSGLLADTEGVVGMTYCYANTYNGIRLADGFVKVFMDEDGIYSAINNWKTIDTPSQDLHALGNIINSENAENAVFSFNKDAGEVRRNELVYAPVEGSSYKLHYEIELDDGTAYLVDSVTAEVQQILE